MQHDFVGADFNLKPAQIISQYLGHFVYIRYACHTKKAMLVEVGVDWALFTDGGMVSTPSITLISTVMPKDIASVRPTHIPNNLEDLFL